MELPEMLGDGRSVLGAADEVSDCDGCNMDAPGLEALESAERQCAETRLADA
jgi:hypothetical protein